MGLSESFKSTCKVLFGQEVGQLSDFREYLTGIVDSPMKVNSSLTGKEVYLSRPYYDRRARFANLVELEGKEVSLSINEIKDIDSILAALGEKMSYCGGKNLGVSRDIEQSDSTNDSVETLYSYNVMSSKRVAFSNGVRDSENVFGCQLGGEISFTMRSQIIFFSNRCFETYLSKSCGDLYFSFNCRDCSESLFSFNQVSKNHMVGNLELPRDKYGSIKKELLGQVSESLSRRKGFPSLFEIAKTGEING